MKAATDQTNPLFRLAEQFAGPMSQSRDDLFHLSNLHPEFVAEGLAAIDSLKAHLTDPGLGELFPHMLAQGLQLRDQDRRKLAAAWLALYGYIRLVDDSLDKTGYLNGRVSIIASALLGWGLATMGRYTVGTKYEPIFLENVTESFAGQYEDVRNRANEAASRERSDVDKNRVFVAAAVGFCAAANQSDDRLIRALSDDRLIRAMESSIGAWQVLDDLEDLKEDYDENNLTAFVRIVRECASSVDPPARSEMYKTLIKDPRTKVLLAQAAKTIRETLLFLDPTRDFALVDYIGGLSERTDALIRALDDYQQQLISDSEVMDIIDLVSSGYGSLSGSINSGYGSVALQRVE